MEEFACMRYLGIGPYYCQYGVCVRVRTCMSASTSELASVCVRQKDREFIRNKYFYNVNEDVADDRQHQRVIPQRAKELVRNGRALLYYILAWKCDTQRAYGQNSATL